MLCVFCLHRWPVAEFGKRIAPLCYGLWGFSQQNQAIVSIAKKQKIYAGHKLFNTDVLYTTSYFFCPQKLEGSKLGTCIGTVLKQSNESSKQVMWLVVFLVALSEISNIGCVHAMYFLFSSLGCIWNLLCCFPQWWSKELGRSSWGAKAITHNIPRGQGVLLTLMCKNGVACHGGTYELHTHNVQINPVVSINWNTILVVGVQCTNYY